MNAEEARALSNNHVRKHVSTVVLAEVHRRIQEACEKGQYSIMNPQHSIDGKHLDKAAVNQLKKLLEDDGYKWEDHLDPDPGHPCSAPYTTLSW